MYSHDSTSRCFRNKWPKNLVSISFHQVQVLCVLTCYCSVMYLLSGNVRQIGAREVTLLHRLSTVDKSYTKPAKQRISWNDNDKTNIIREEISNRLNLRMAATVNFRVSFLLFPCLTYLLPYLLTYLFTYSMKQSPS
jgi:hypothetical protein